MKGNSDVAHVLAALRGERPEVILGRIFEGDPLGLQTRVMRVLRSNGFLLDPERCMQHALEEISILVSRASPLDGEPMDRVWIERCVESACDRILAEDLESERLVGLGVGVDTASHRFLSEAFGVTWGQGCAASVAFHRLTLRARLTFFAVCVDRLPAAKWLEHTGGTHAELRGDIWDAFCALGYVSEHEVAEFRARG